MYALLVTIDHYYWEYDCKLHHARQVEKKTLKSHFWKQGKASSTGNTAAFQSKANTFLAASFVKLSPFNILFTASKKQSKSL